MQSVCFSRLPICRRQRTASCTCYFFVCAYSEPPRYGVIRVTECIPCFLGKTHAYVAARGCDRYCCALKKSSLHAVRKCATLNLVVRINARQLISHRLANGHIRPNDQPRPKRQGEHKRKHRKPARKKPVRKKDPANQCCTYKRTPFKPVLNGENMSVWFATNRSHPFGVSYAIRHVHFQEKRSGPIPEN